jgi:hypothetical protein
LAVVALAALNCEPHLLAEAAADEAPDTVCLPAGGFHDVGEKGNTPAKAFQTSTNREMGQPADILANSFSVAKRWRPSGICSAAAKAVMLFSLSIVKVVMVFLLFFGY